jgi:Protein  of unknown function (DUF3018)
MGMHEKLTGAQRTARYRAAKRAKGLRLKQIWVPDLNNPEVRARIAHEVQEMNRRDRESGIMEEIDALADEVLASLPPYDWGDNPPE